MDLVIDLGNTNKKLALFNDGQIADVMIVRDLDLQILVDFTVQHPGIENCILSSVIDHPDSFGQFLGRQFNYIELDETTPVPVINLYRTPETLGKDRLAAAVAGATAFPGKNVLVINMGSCITYDFISYSREYTGGSISPGLQMRFLALNTFTGKLPLVDIKEQFDLTGNDTENSIISGVVNGITAEIEGIAQKYCEAYDDLHIILSGGDMVHFDKRLKISIFAVPNIVLQGLYQILAFNVKKIK